MVPAWKLRVCQCDGVRLRDGAMADEEPTLLVFFGKQVVQRLQDTACVATYRVVCSLRGLPLPKGLSLIG